MHAQDKIIYLLKQEQTKNLANCTLSLFAIRTVALPRERRSTVGTYLMDSAWEYAGTVLDKVALRERIGRLPCLF